MRPIQYLEGVELVVTPAPVGIQQVNFPDIPQLRSDSTQDIIIRSLRIFPQEAIPNGWSGNVNATQAQIASGFLTLYSEGMNKIYQVPLLQFNNIFSNDAAGKWAEELMQADDWVIDWTKSYVSFSTPLVVETQFVFLFSIGYIKLPPGTINKQRAVRSAAIAQGVVSKS